MHSVRAEEEAEIAYLEERYKNYLAKGQQQMAEALRVQEEKKKGTNKLEAQKLKRVLFR